MKFSRNKKQTGSRIGAATLLLITVIYRYSMYVPYIVQYGTYVPLELISGKCDLLPPRLELKTCLAVFRICIYYYADPDPGIKFSPFGSGAQMGGGGVPKTQVKFKNITIINKSFIKI